MGEAKMRIKSWVIKNWDNMEKFLLFFEPRETLPNRWEYHVKAENGKTAVFQSASGVYSYWKNQNCPTLTISIVEK